MLHLACFACWMLWLEYIVFLLLAGAFCTVFCMLFEFEYLVGRILHLPYCFFLQLCVRMRLGVSDVAERCCIRTACFSVSPTRCLSWVGDFEREGAFMSSVFVDVSNGVSSWMRWFRHCAHFGKFAGLYRVCSSLFLSWTRFGD